MKDTKLTIITFLIICLHTIAKAQTVSNFCNPVTKAIFYNEKRDKILLEYNSTSKSFEVPSITMCYPLGPIIDSFSKKTGLLYNTITINGEFKYINKNNVDTTYITYYTLPFAGYMNNKGLLDTSAFKWCHFKNAVFLSAYPTNALILKKILGESQIAWTATFLEYGFTVPFNRDKIKYQIIRDFEQLKIK